MKSFSELLAGGIVSDNTGNYFAVKRVSIEDVANQEITIIDTVPNIKTEHGEGRTLIHFKYKDGTEGKFFTNSRMIKEVLAQIPKTEYPFTTTIVGIRDGNKKLYKLT
ncbi:MAG: hypothetical protein MJZ66_02735 [Bacteroidales bacterium]|nr:hypothetical protein [Bacteroidales bacterium]